MKPWPAIGRIDAGLDFGRGAVPLGGAATAAGRTVFQYDASFLRRGVDPSPLRLRFAASPQPGARDLDGLPGLLHDSLPDGWSRLVLDRYIRSRGYDHTSLGAIDRLALVGAHGPGALVYRGRTEMPLEAPGVDFDTAAALVTKAPEEVDADRIEAALTLTRSLGGARPKAYVHLADGRFSTLETPGATPWIVKFPARQDGPEDGAVEYAFSLMAVAAGINMPPTRLLPSAHTAGFFAVQRFDRLPGGGRLHVHSLAGLLNAPAGHNGLGYAELLQVTGHLTQTTGGHHAAIEEQIRRMAFNVLAHNRDDHAKNHAFLMDERGTWRCAPAFDLTYSNLGEHALHVGGDGRRPGTENMLAVARSANFPESRARDVIAEVREAVGDWPKHARAAGVGGTLTKDIANALEGVDANSPDAWPPSATWRNRGAER